MDEERRQDIIRRKQYCIEIDFSDLLKKGYSEKKVQDRLESDFSHRKWICCPKWDEENRIKAQSMHKIRVNKYSHFILYPNGEATLIPLNSDTIEPFKNITPTNEAIFEVIVMAPNTLEDHAIYQYCYHKAVQTIYKLKDCRTCKNRIYDEPKFQNRDLRIDCKIRHESAPRFKPPQYAITCNNYEFDSQLTNYKAHILYQIK